MKSQMRYITNISLGIMTFFIKPAVVWVKIKKNKRDQFF